MPTPRDYETAPDRYRLGMRLSSSYGGPGADLYGRIVDLLRDARVERVLDLGSGEGALASAAAPTGLTVISVDGAAPMVSAARHHGPALRAELTALPVSDVVVDAAVAVNVLDHLDDPVPALREAHRVLRPGGVFVAGAISRDDSPELAPHWRPAPTPFDAEDAPALVDAVFGHARVERWDAPLVTLPDVDTLRDYLVARFVAPDEAAARAEAIAASCGWPLPITKRGALIIAHR